MKIIKINLISVIVVNVITVCLILISCKDNPVNTTNNNPTSISGKIESWHYGKNMKLKARVYTGLNSMYIDSCNIDSIGNFLIHYISPPDSIFLPMNLTDTGCLNTIIISPAGTKSANVSLDVFDSLNNYIRSIEWMSDSLEGPHNGKTFGLLICIDRRSLVNGIDSCYQSGITTIEIWNVSFVEGWNSLYFTYNSYNPLYYYKGTYSTSQPKALKWYLLPIYQNKNKDFPFSK